jgi:predicted DNA-binding protein
MQRKYMDAEKKDTKMITFPIRMPRWELERLRKAAQDDGRSAAAYVRRAVMEKVQKGGAM